MVLCSVTRLDPRVYVAGLGRIVATVILHGANYPFFHRIETLVLGIDFSLQKFSHFLLAVIGRLYRQLTLPERFGANRIEPLRQGIVRVFV